MGKTLFSELKINYEANIVTLANYPSVNIEDKLDEPIGKYTQNDRLTLYVRRRPVEISIWRDDKLIDRRY